MKQFLDKVYKVGIGNFELSDFSPEDLALFVSCFNEIQSLVASYPNSYTRKQLSQEIQDKIEPTKTFLNLLVQKLEGVQNHFNCLDCSIRDGDLAMRLLVRLANTYSSRYIVGAHYALKAFFLSEKVTLTTSRNGDSEDVAATGKVWLLGDKAVIASIQEKTYTGREFKQVLTDILKNNHSIIVCTSTYFCEDVLSPNSYSLQRIHIPATGSYRYIMCYLTEGPLMDAVTKFKTWIEKNGTDFTGFNEDKLFELIQNS